MDFPPFFQRPSRYQAITTRWFRGLSVLTHDLTRKDGETIQPVTGETCSDNDNPIHVINKPMKAIYKSCTPAAQDILPAKPGIRYFVHSVNISARLVAGDTTTYCLCAGYLNGGVVSLFVLPTVPSAAGAYSNQAIVDVMFDENTNLYTSCGVAAPTYSNVTITYCEVGGS